MVPAGKGREIVTAQKKEAMQRKQQKTSMVTIIMFMILALTFVIYIVTVPHDLNIILIGIIAAAIIFFMMRYSGTRQESYMVPKLLITHDDKDTPPFIDATGAHAGALLGDVKHDPFQSGGLETRPTRGWRWARSTRLPRASCSSMRSIC